MQIFGHPITNDDFFSYQYGCLLLDQAGIDGESEEDKTDYWFHYGCSP
jgi:hypothetical protein